MYKQQQQNIIQQTEQVLNKYFINIMNTKYVSVTPEQANLCVYMSVCLCVKVFYMAANTSFYL